MSTLSWIVLLLIGLFVVQSFGGVLVCLWQYRKDKKEFGSEEALQKFKRNLKGIFFLKS